jgi:hypothetical protein
MRCHLENLYNATAQRMGTATIYNLKQYGGEVAAKSAVLSNFLQFFRVVLPFICLKATTYPCFEATRVLLYLVSPTKQRKYYNYPIN